MQPRIQLCIVLASSVAIAAVPSRLYAQRAAIPAHVQAYELHSGLHSGVGAEAELSRQETVTVPGAAWLRIHFGAHRLGSASYITLISAKDGGWQWFDAGTLPQWGDASALFNGDTVVIALHVAPGDENVFYTIKEVTVGEWVGGAPLEGDPPTETLCGNDDRAGSNDPRVGRITPVGCTGWIVSNGAHLTAGHCTGANMQILEFNVPASQADGTIVASNPNDQYPIGAVSSFDDGDGQEGDDWAVFACNINSNTRLLPVFAQSAFYRMSRDDNPANVRVTGYGTDSTPAGSTGAGNAQNQTQQTHAGGYGGETVQGASDVIIRHTVDSEGGNSGSPVIILDTLITVGIHTNGGCTAKGGSNAGTGFEHDALETTLANWPGPRVRYVDNGHPHAVSLGDGTVMRPFDLLTEGIDTVPFGGIVSIVSGTYTLPVNKIFSRPMTLSSPVGTTLIVGN